MDDKLYIPTTRVEVSDRIYVMASEYPDFHNSVVPWVSYENSFKQLYLGLENIRPKLGEDLYGRLIVWAQEVQRLREEGDQKQGLRILQDMSEWVRTGERPKWANRNAVT